MKKNQLLVGLLFLATGLQAQVLTNNGQILQVKSGGIMQINGAFTNKTGSTFANDGTVNATGNIQNDQTMTSYYTGTLNVNGTSAQTISGSKALYVKNVNFNNTAGITLSNEVKADGTVSFTNGLITATTSTAPLTYTANASTSSTAVATDANHVNGYVVKEGTGLFTYPVGDATKYQKVEVNPTANATGIKVRYYPSDAGTGTFTTTGSETTALNTYNSKEYWDILPNSTATGTVTLYYDAYLPASITDVTTLRVAHKNGGNWLNEGGTATGTTTAGNITSNAVSTWSPFTLGSIANNTLGTSDLLKSENAVFPNPTTGIFFVKSSSDAPLSVYSASGKLVKSQKIAKGQTSVDITNLPAGMYLVKIGDKTYKVIKR